VTRPSHDLTLT